MSAVPRIVIVERDGMPTTIVVWDTREWCTRIPPAWLRHCGCARCCDAWRVPREWLQIIDRDGFALIDYHHGIPFFARRDPRDTSRVCISPWPRRLYARLF